MPDMAGSPSSYGIEIEVWYGLEFISVRHYRSRFRVGGCVDGVPWGAMTGCETGCWGVGSCVGV